MATTDLKDTLAASRSLFNGFANIFNFLIPKLSPPELSGVVQMFKAVSDTANAHSNELRQAIAAAGGLSPVSPMSDDEKAAAAVLKVKLDQALQDYEQANNGRQVFAIILTRDANGKVSTGDITLI